MNITRENIDDLNAVLKINFVRADFEEKVESVLKDYRKKATIKGFRPGMVPIGLVKKMYGTAVQIDEINKLVTDNIQKYIADEKIEILGDPMPLSDEREHFDFETQEEFTFSFELGLAPAFEVNLSKNNKVINYEIIIDEKMKNDFINNYTRRFGELRQAQAVEEKDVLKGSIEAVDSEGNTLPEGPAVESVSIAVDLIKDEEIKSAFMGKAISDSIVFDLKKAYPNDNEIAGILHKTKDEVADLQGDFRFTINEISRFYPAEIGQELFDKVYGEGVITSEEEFNKKIEGETASNLKYETDYKLMLDLKALALNTTEFSLPEEFLKRWLLKVNEKTTVEQIDQEFDSFRKDLKWQLIRNKVARDNEMQITEEELLNEAAKITRQQFNQYGLYYATDDQINNYAKETLKREEDAKRIADKVIDDKILTHFRGLVELVGESISAEGFNKLFE